MHVVEHHIQREIIDRLMRAESVRFKDLKPLGMESNIFMYHLKQLIKQNLVTKIEGGYTLAPFGLSYVDNLNTTEKKLQSQPKIIAIAAIRTQTGQWLMAERKIQPFIRKYMLISGRQHLGETAQEHSIREVQEKLGITVAPMYRGQAETLLYDVPSKTLLTHVLGGVYEVTLEKPIATPPETDYFRYVWIDDAYKDMPMLPGTKELMAAITDASDTFFFSYKNI